MSLHTESSLRSGPCADDPMAEPALGSRVSIVICTVDDHETIGGVLDEVVADPAGPPHEVIVVDGSMDDLTAQVVLSRAWSNPIIRLVRHEGVGLVAAAIAGGDQATGDVLAIMDSCGQYHPRLIARMASRLDDATVDLVIASRLAGDGPGLAGRNSGRSRAGEAALGLLLGLSLTDPMSGCFVMRRSWYAGVRSCMSGVGSKVLIDIDGPQRRRPRLLQIQTAVRPPSRNMPRFDWSAVFSLAALLVERRTRGALSARMTLFLLVSLTGLLIHLMVSTTGRELGAPFWFSHGGAILTAMSWNFMLNNAVTFRDQQLRGGAVWQGLLGFYLACLGGAMVSEVVGAGLRALTVPWGVAGAVAALLGAIWNYGAVQRLTWRRLTAAQRARALVISPAGRAACLWRLPKRAAPVADLPQQNVESGGMAKLSRWAGWMPSPYKLTHLPKLIRRNI